MSKQFSIKRVGLFKRFLVMLYDGLLLFSLLFFTSAIWMLILNLLAPDTLYLDPNKLEAQKLAAFTDFGKWLAFSIVVVNVLAVSFFFYGWFWTHGGQTLGMRVWNLYLTKPDGKFIDWPLAAKRYAYALLSWGCVGLGFLWLIIHPQRKTWHDILSNTQLIYHKAPTPKNKK